MDEVEGKAVNGIVERDALAAAGGIIQVVDLGCSGQCLGGEAQVIFRLDVEGNAGELVCIRPDGTDYPRVGAIAAEVDLVVRDLLFWEEAEILQEPGLPVEVCVLVVDMGDTLEADPAGADDGSHVGGRGSEW